MLESFRRKGLTDEDERIGLDTADPGRKFLLHIPARNACDVVPEVQRGKLLTPHTSHLDIEIPAPRSLARTCVPRCQGLSCFWCLASASAVLRGHRVLGLASREAGAAGDAAQGWRLRAVVGSWPGINISTYEPTQIKVCWAFIVAR